MMNLEIFKQNDPSGKLAKEEYLMKNHPEIWSAINDFFNDIDIPFKEKIFLFLNRLQSRPKCSNPNCQKECAFLSVSRGYRKYCSNICISSDPSIKKIKEEKSISKWGTKTPAQNETVKNKMITTNLSRYGSNSPLQNNLISEKSKQTLLSNWNVDNPSKNKTILQKRVSSFKNSDYRESFKRTSLEKWNKEHPWQDKSVHRKSIETSKEKKKNNSIESIQKKLLSYDGYFFHDLNYDNKLITLTCQKGHLFSIYKHTFDERVAIRTEICTTCKPVGFGVSGLELQFRQFIESLNISFVSNDRKVIAPYEVDIYIPDLNLSIEFNGLYWHSAANKDKLYHQMKWQKCQEKAINLINVWEDDWLYKQDIIKSWIKNAVGKIDQKIFARKCVIKEVDSKTTNMFLHQNHLQGQCSSSIKIGLYYQEELVSLMTFSRTRLPMLSIKEKEGWEMVRFCSKKNIIVVGAASKLLSFFEKNYKPRLLFTFSDNSSFTGSIYEKLGFELQYITKPGYTYLVKGQRQHRFNWRKSKLIKLGADSSKTEEEIMSDYGYPRIYNSGNKKWIKWY